MSTKVVLEEQLQRLENEIKADEAWIDFIDRKTEHHSDALELILDRLERLELSFNTQSERIIDMAKALNALCP